MSESLPELLVNRNRYLKFTITGGRSRLTRVSDLVSICDNSEDGGATVVALEGGMRSTYKINETVEEIYNNPRKYTITF